MLAHIHGLVCQLYHLVLGGCVDRVCGVTDCRRQSAGIVSTNGEVKTLDSGPNTLGNNLGASCVGFHQQSGKFIATITEQHIGVADALAQQITHLAQNVAAGQVAMHIVDALEKVQVDEGE